LAKRPATTGRRARKETNARPGAEEIVPARAGQAGFGEKFCGLRGKALIFD